MAAAVVKQGPVIHLYHRTWLWAYSPKLSGLLNVPDGLLRLQGLKLGS